MSQSLELARPYLGKKVTVTMDRPLGSKHPKWGFIYEVNYGYIPNTLAPDGAELDAYFLGTNEPLEEATGTCIAVIHRLEDDDDKLVVVPENLDLSDDDIRQATHFQEYFFKSVILRI